MARQEALVDLDKTQRLLRKRTKNLSLRINQDLMKMIETEVDKEKKFQSKTDLVENLLLRYFLEQGKL